jgi:6-phosphogluconolactonase
MKFSQFGRFTLAAVALTAMCLSISACSVGFAIDYLYVTTATSNMVYAYNVDSSTGSLTTINTYPSGGTDPVAEVVTPSGKTIYVANNGSASIAQFTVNTTDGTLTAGPVVSLPGTGTGPTYLAVDPEGLNLLVCYSHKTGTSGVGGVAVYPINSGTGNLGTGTAYSVGNGPSGLNVTEFVETNHMYFAYVVDQTDAQILAFTLNATSGVLTPTSPASFPAGVAPYAIVTGPTARYAYVTDSFSNQLLGYDIGSGGQLTPMIDSPFATGSFPKALTVDPRGLFLYVTDYNASSISPFALNVTTGEPATVPLTSANNTDSTGTYPTAIVIDPALGQYIFTANFLDNSVTALTLNANTGVMTAVENTPFNTGAQPTAVVAVAAGNHATQIVQP